MGAYCNTKRQVEALEDLLRKLPDPAAPLPTPLNRPKPGRAHQLGTDQIQELIAGYRGGAGLLTGDQLMLCHTDDDHGQVEHLTVFHPHVGAGLRHTHHTAQDRTESAAADRSHSG